MTDSGYRKLDLSKIIPVVHWTSVLNCLVSCQRQNNKLVRPPFSFSPILHTVPQLSDFAYIYMCVCVCVCVCVYIYKYISVCVCFAWEWSQGLVEVLDPGAPQPAYCHAQPLPPTNTSLICGLCSLRRPGRWGRY